MVNNRVYLDSIVGSNSFNLQTDKSDIDEYILFKGNIVFVDSIEKDKKIDYHFTNVNNFLNKLYSKETIKYEFYNLVKDEVWGGYAIKQFDAIRNGTYDVIGIREYVMKDVKIHQKLKEHLRTKGVRPDIN